MHPMLVGSQAPAAPEPLTLACCRRFTCNVCDLMNDVPVEYYAGVDMTTGRRTDEAQRPELSFGSVEYVAPTEYMVSTFASLCKCMAKCLATRSGGLHRPAASSLSAGATSATTPCSAQPWLHAGAAANAADVLLRHRRLCRGRLQRCAPGDQMSSQPDVYSCGRPQDVCLLHMSALHLLRDRRVVMFKSCMTP
jgi:hypothetical protein